MVKKIFHILPVLAVFILLISCAVQKPALTTGQKKIFIYPAYTDIEMFLNTTENEIVSHRFIYVGQLIRLK